VGERRLDRRDLMMRAARAASGLSSLGLREGDTLVLLLGNCMAFLEASLAAAQIGAYAIPFNWRLKPDELQFLLQDSGARALLVEAGPKESLTGVLPPGLPVLWRGDDWDNWVDSFAPRTAPPATPKETLFYTSGTTGRPKGVVRLSGDPVKAANAFRLRQTIYGLWPESRALLPGPMYHSAPNSFALMAARQCELLVVMARFDAEELLGLIERHRITNLLAVPTMLRRLLHLPAATRGRYDLSSLRRIVHAAAPCPPDVKRGMIDWLGPVLWEFYGGTEPGMMTACDSTEWLAYPGTVGRVLPGVTLRIVDGDRECGPGEAGEILVDPAFPDFTYRNAPEKRAELNRHGLLSTGDVGEFDAEGYLYLRDRKRDMAIVGGANVYPAEIESVIQALPGVRDCAVFGIPDEDLGEVLMAVIEPGAGAVPGQIQADIRNALAGFKRPRRIEFRAALPRDESGKLFKRLLRDEFWKGRESNV
jgi:long-chain acyl-CoA synthetase